MQMSRNSELTTFIFKRCRSTSNYIRLIAFNVSNSSSKRLTMQSTSITALLSCASTLMSMSSLATCASCRGCRRSFTSSRESAKKRSGSSLIPSRSPTSSGRWRFQNLLRNLDRLASEPTLSPSTRSLKWKRENYSRSASTEWITCR